ncbi:MAG: ATP-binding protein [Pseudomonadota bacterium]
MGHKAASAGIKTQFTAATDLILKVDAAQRQGRLSDLLRTLSRVRFSFIDEIGYLPLNREQARLFFQIVVARHEKGSTIMTSNLSFGAWDRAFACDRVLTAAILDRLLHHAQVIQIQGESHRLNHEGKAGIVGPAKERETIAA